MTDAPAMVMNRSMALALRDDVVELKRCQDAIADVEILCYEAWEFDRRLTKDGARRLLQIAGVFGWDMPWVAEMRDWAA